MARTAKKKIQILDEGIVLVDDVDSIDFIGAGVSGTNIGNNVTENISGSSGGNPIDNETVSGSGTTFTLANTPVSGSVKLYGLGQRLKLTTDYSISGQTITTVNSWGTGEITADYRI